MKRLKELEAEVWFTSNELIHFSKEKLIDAVLEVQGDLMDLYVEKA